MAFLFPAKNWVVYSKSTKWHLITHIFSFVKIELKDETHQPLEKDATKCAQTIQQSQYESKRRRASRESLPGSWKE